MTTFHNMLVSAYLAILGSVCVFVTLHDDNEKSRLHGIDFLSKSGNIVGIFTGKRKKDLGFKCLNPSYLPHKLLFLLLVPGARIELAQPQGSRDFKSLASTSSATQAQCLIMEETVRLILFLIWRVKDLITWLYDR